MPQDRSITPKSGGTSAIWYTGKCHHLAYLFYASLNVNLKQSNYSQYALFTTTLKFLGEKKNGGKIL